MKGMELPYYPLFRYNIRFRGSKYSDWALHVDCDRNGDVIQGMSVTCMVLDLTDLKFKSKGKIPTSEFLRRVNDLLREVSK